MTPIVFTADKIDSVCYDPSADNFPFEVVLKIDDRLIRLYTVSRFVFDTLKQLMILFPTRFMSEVQLQGDRQLDASSTEIIVYDAIAVIQTNPTMTIPPPATIIENPPLPTV